MWFVSAAHQSTGPLIAERVCAQSGGPDEGLDRETATCGSVGRDHLLALEPVSQRPRWSADEQVDGDPEAGMGRGQR